MTHSAQGSSFDDFLREQVLLENVESIAITRVLAWQLAERMKSERITKKEMALRMGTSRSQLDRLLKPGDESVTLDSIERAAHALGRRVRLELI